MRSELPAGPGQNFRGQIHHGTGGVNECKRAGGKEFAEQGNMAALAAAVVEQASAVQGGVLFQHHPQGIEYIQSLEEAGVVRNTGPESRYGVKVVSTHAILDGEAEKVKAVDRPFHFILILEPVATPAVGELHHPGLVVHFIRRHDQGRDRLGRE